MLRQPRPLVPFTFPRAAVPFVYQLPGNPLAIWYAGDGTSQPIQLTVSGGLVSAWDTVRGSSTILSATGAARPTYTQTNSSLNNRGSLLFDGIATYLALSSSGIVASLSSYVIYAVARKTGVSTNAIRDVYAERGATSIPVVDVGIRSNPNSGMVVRDDASHSISQSGSSSLDDNLSRLLVLTRASSTFTWRENGVQKATGSATIGTTTITTIAIGDSVIGGAPFSPQLWVGDIAFVGIFPDNTNLTDIEAALNSHYAIY